MKPTEYSQLLNFVARGQPPRLIHHALFDSELTSDRLTLEDGGRVAKSVHATYSTAICDTSAYDGCSWEFKVLSGVGAVVGFCTDRFDVSGAVLGVQPNSLGYRQTGGIAWTDAEGQETLWDSPELVSGDTVRMSYSAGVVSVFLNHVELLVHDAGGAGDIRAATSLMSGSVSLNTGQAHFYGPNALVGTYRKVHTSLTSEVYYQGYHLLPLSESAGNNAYSAAGVTKGLYSGTVQFQLPSITKDSRDVAISLGTTGTLTTMVPEVTNQPYYRSLFRPDHRDAGSVATLFDTGWLTVSLILGMLDVTVGGESIYRGSGGASPQFNYSVLLCYSNGRLRIWSGVNLLADSLVDVPLTSGTPVCVGTNRTHSNRFRGLLSHFVCTPHVLQEWQRLRISKYLETGEWNGIVKDSVTMHQYTLPSPTDLNFDIARAMETIRLEPYHLPKSSKLDFSSGAAG